MAVRIRLRRQGGRNKPFYRIVVADARHPNQGRFIESLGWYDPQKEGENFQIKADRVEYWITKGAQVSDTVMSFVRRVRKAAKSAPVAPAAEPTPASAE